MVAEGRVRYTARLIQIITVLNLAQEMGFPRIPRVPSSRGGGPLVDWMSVALK